MPFDVKQLGGAGAKIAMAFLAAKQAGPQAAAAFLQGIQQQQQQADAQGKQDARQSMLDQSALATQQQSRDNMVADNARADQQQQYTQTQGAMTSLDSLAQSFGDVGNPVTDPAQAENALMQRAATMASLQGKPPDTYTGMIRPVAPLITAKTKKQAQVLYERAEKRFNAKGENPGWETSITLQTGDQFGDVTPAKLREMFEAPAVDAMGAPALPPAPAVKPPSEGASDLDRSYQREKKARELKTGRPLTVEEEAALDGEIRQSVRAITSPASGEASDARRFTQEQRLVAQWDKANTPFREMRRQLGLMEGGLKRFRAGDPNGGGQAVLVTFQKILDPTSVVRESEYARTAAGQSLLNRIEGYADRLAKGGPGMTDTELAAMVETGREFLAGMESYTTGLRGRIERTSQEYKLDPRMIFDDVADPAAPAGAKKYEIVSVK